MSSRPPEGRARRVSWGRWILLGLALAAVATAVLRWRAPTAAAIRTSPGTRPAAHPPAVPTTASATRSSPEPIDAAGTRRPGGPRTALTAVCLLAAAVLLVSLSPRFVAAPSDPGSGPLQAAPPAPVVAGRVVDVDPHPDLGPGWPRVTEILDRAVASAALQGFRLSMCLHAVDTTRGESYCAGDAGQEHYAASSIKIAIAVAVLERDLDNLDEVVQVLPSDIRDGSGTIKYLGAGPYPLGELVRLMIVASDNSATVTLLRRLGSVDAANAPTQRMSDPPAFTVGNFGQAVGPGPDTGSLSAQGAAAYLTELLSCADGQACSLTSREVAETVVEHMRKQQIVTKVGLYLEPGSFGSKAGDMDLVSHDVAFADTARGRIVLTAASTAADPAYPDPVIALAARDVVAAIAAG